MKTIANHRLKSLRESEELTQREVAEKINVNRKTYSSWEKQECDIPLQKFNDIANLYNISLDYLLGRSDNYDYVEKRDIDKNKISERLKLLRKQKKYSQERLGNKVGFFQGTYSNFEVGTSIPTTFKLLAFADFYKVSMDYLTGRKDDKEIS